MAFPAPVEQPPQSLPPGDALAERLGGDLLPGLHEVFAADSELGTGLGFAAMLAARRRRVGPVLWLRDDRGRRDTCLYGWGFAELSLSPDRLILVQCPDPVVMLRAANEIVGCGEVAAVVIESSGRIPKMDLTATRRLHLRAISSGVLLVSLRTAVEPEPSAALTRWRVEAAPSRMLPALAPGMPRLVLTLLRHRAGIAPFEVMLEWDVASLGFLVPGKTRHFAIGGPRLAAGSLLRSQAA